MMTFEKEVDLIREKKAIELFVSIFGGSFKKLDPHDIDYKVFDKNNNLIEAFNNFSRVYNTNGNMRLMTENFHRRRTLANVKNWVMINYLKFDK